MQIVIDIPEGNYKAICETKNVWEREPKQIIYLAIANGIPLPKGHGRLGDLDALEKEMVNGIKAGNYEEGYEKYAHINDMDDCVDAVVYADTIIEADVEESER